MSVSRVPDDVAGTLVRADCPRRCRQTLIVPHDNSAEAAVVEGVDVYGACSLSQVVQFLRPGVLNHWLV